MAQAGWPGCFFCQDWYLALARTSSPQRYPPFWLARAVRTIAEISPNHRDGCLILLHLFQKEFSPPCELEDSPSCVTVFLGGCGMVVGRALLVFSALLLNLTAWPAPAPAAN